MSQKNNSENKSPDIVFLINSASGTTRGRSLIQTLERHRSSLAIKVIPINWAVINEQIELASTASLVVLAGGDGTLSSLIPMFTKSSAKIAILPLGTGDDLAKALKREKDPTLYAVLCDGLKAFEPEATKLNICQILDNNSKEKLATFVNYFSIGFSAEVISKFAHRRKNSSPKFRQSKTKLFQRMIYVLIGIKSLDTSLPENITVTSKNVRLTTTSKNICLIFSNIYS